MKKLLLSILVFVTISSQAQLIDAWKVGSDMMSFSRKRVFESPNGNLILARMDDYYGIGDGMDLLRCYSVTGELIWSFGEEDFTDNSGSNFIDIDFDSESNVYIAGSNFPQSASYPKTEVIKISPTGEELWRINFTQQSNWAEEVFEIEITEDDRIFLLATLYNSGADTIIPHFIEIDDDGQTVTLIPDNAYDIGQAQLFDFGDGFLYAVEEYRITKLNYDGTVIWHSDINFGVNYYASFGYEGAEYLVKNYNGTLVCAMRVDDSNFNEQYFGIAVVQQSSGDAEFFLHTIFEELTSLYGINPLYLEINSTGDKYVVGDYLYGEGSSNFTDTDDRGGKGSTYRGTFVQKVNVNNSLSWMLSFPEIEGDDYRTAKGTFIHQNELGVVYQNSNFDMVNQLTEFYDEQDGSVIWSHVENANEVNDKSSPAACMIASDGSFYTCGSGEYYGEENTDYNIYLYKYSFTPVGILNASDKASFTIYPNPASELLNVQFSGGFQFVKILDNFGRVVHYQKLVSQTGSIDISALASGYYQLRLLGESVAVKSFIKE